MCRSIKTLREPYTEQVTDADVRAAALQYVRKISGFRAPASHKAQGFEHAGAAGAAAPQDLLDHLEVRGQRAASCPPAPDKPRIGPALSDEHDRRTEVT